MESNLATIYVWEKRNLDVDNLLFVLGGKKAPTYTELKSQFDRNHRKPISLRHYSNEFEIYQSIAGTEPLVKDPHYTGDVSPFLTFDLEKRLKKLELSLPEHELQFNPRESNDYKSVDLARVGGLALYLVESLSAKDVLAVNGTDIENGVIYASPGIERKVSDSILI
ncbi:hypothetical protein HOE04_01630 [archaeon]|jgi:hypothetical protein|nr:hypothetical protein [archaeon]